ncbi:hypothetical protein ACFL24_02820 [Patescibacteria group bacterium]
MMKFKTVLLIVVILFVLSLDFAALQDIMKEKESNYYAEYAILSFSVMLFAVLGLVKLRKKK